MLTSDKVDSLIQSAVEDLELVRLTAMNKKTEQIKEMNENKFEEFADKINRKTDQLEDKVDQINSARQNQPQPSGP